ncbi:unnamed protein product [Staurois parvus]|uniref:Metalloendopeptidase n=1 Tax=Staurois parvus TaxID=386267 RepID=A0ABN9EE08_9NEOB|nr:unnamed protein product [Staurois parvus]
MKGIVQHELNHVLGFVHEHTRSDRDTYVYIEWTHIPDVYKSNFETTQPATNNLGLPYDYTSVMHYGRYAFSNAPGKATIVPKLDPSILIGQRYGLSGLDLQKINRLYQCDVCSSLLCDPSGSLHSGYVQSDNQNRSQCVWLIRVPTNKVQLNFISFALESSRNCVYDYLSISDSSRSGTSVSHKYCGAKNMPSLVSSSNWMLLQFHSDKSVQSTGFRVTYSWGK